MANVQAPWPSWPEFTLDEKTSATLASDADYSNAKKAIIAEFGEDDLRKSWLKTCAALKDVTDELATKGNAVMPSLDMQDVLNNTVSETTKSEVRRVGAFTVRGVIPKDEISAMFTDLKEYTKTNAGKVKGWPENTPSILKLYNTPTQNAARTHPNQLALMRWINSLWTFTPSEDVSAEPLLYADAVRVRPPHQPFLGLGPHIDAGSLCRWAEPNYRKFYANVFSGKPEEHDCFDLDARKDADQMMFPGRGQSSVLRAFQGWTALTKTAPREGTIRFFPAVKWAIAYVLLRPFFKPPQDESKIMDASAWNFDADSAWFPGTDKQTSQYLSSSSHPHLRLKECLVYAPALDAGDTVWWHADMCHAVDAEHIGTEDASVAYIAATPTTKINKEYMRRQYEFMVKGLSPPDFGSGAIDESIMEGFQGFSANPALFKTLMAAA